MPTTEQKQITPAVIKGAMNYEEFKTLIYKQLEEGKTTGANQSEELTEYTRLNRQRMKRVTKKTELCEPLKKKVGELDESWIWLVLAEGWCGDVAQNLPVIHKMADISSNIDLKILLRTTNTDIMDQYLTNGGRSIPKLVCLDANTLNEKGTWGPRPENFQKKAMQWKDDPEIDHEEWAQKLHKWYAKDESQSIQSDFAKLIDEWR